MTEPKRRPSALVWFLVPTFLLIVFLAFGGIFAEKKPTEDAGRADFICRTLLRSEDIMTLCEQGDIIWAGGKSGVFRIDKTAFTAEKLKFGRSVAYVKSIAVDAAGAVWIGYDGGVLVYDGDTTVWLNKNTGLPDNRVNAVFRDSAGAMWVATWGGLAILRDGVWSAITQSDGLKTDMVNTIFEDRAGGMWFGSYAVPDGGVSVLRDGAWQYFNVKSGGLANDNVCGFAEDADGSVWAATGFYDKGGACRFDRGEDGRWTIARTLTAADGLAGEKARSVAFPADGNLWIGSEYFGLAIFRNAAGTIYTTADGLSHNEIKTILQSADGPIWLGTREGITEMKEAAP